MGGSGEGEEVTALTQHKIKDHKDVFQVLECKPEVDKKSVLQLAQDLALSIHILHCMLTNDLHFVHVFHCVHFLCVLFLNYANLLI